VIAMFLSEDKVLMRMGL